MDQNLPNFVPTLTLEVVQQIIVLAFSALSLSCKAFSLVLLDILILGHLII